MMLFKYFDDCRLKNRMKGLAAMEPLASVDYGKKGVVHKDDDIDALFDNILDKNPKSLQKRIRKRNRKRAAQSRKVALILLI